MTYAYFIDNAGNPVPVDNSRLFKYLSIISVPEDNVFTDICSERKEIQNLFNRLKPEDVLIVRSVQDVGNTITQVLRVLKWLAEHGVELVSICEAYYDSADYQQLTADLYKFDCVLKERARVMGYETALAKGRVGRPKNTNTKEALKLYDSKKITAEQICKITAVSSSTLYRALRDRRSQAKNES